MFLCKYAYVYFLQISPITKQWNSRDSYLSAKHNFFKLWFYNGVIKIYLCKPPAYILKVMQYAYEFWTLHRETKNAVCKLWIRTIEKCHNIWQLIYKTLSFRVFWKEKRSRKLHRNISVWYFQIRLCCFAFF